MKACLSCSHQVMDRQYMCHLCWERVSSEAKAEVRKHKPKKGQPASVEYEKAFRRAADEIHAAREFKRELEAYATLVGGKASVTFDGVPVVDL